MRLGSRKLCSCKYESSARGPGNEAEFTAYVRRNGRMTVPKEVRDALRIDEGSLVKCRIRRVETS
jgi:AbrB family looped-hinge helix DNA binding protein